MTKDPTSVASEDESLPPFFVLFVSLWFPLAR